MCFQSASFGNKNNHTSQGKKGFLSLPEYTQPLLWSARLHWGCGWNIKVDTWTVLAAWKIRICAKAWLQQSVQQHLPVSQQTAPHQASKFHGAHIPMQWEKQIHSAAHCRAALGSQQGICIPQAPEGRVPAAPRWEGLHPLLLHRDLLALHNFLTGGSNR